MQSEQINELATALAKAQGEIKSAIKDSSNPFFKSSYADLASVWDACRKPLSANGLSVIQTTEINDKGAALVTTLAHSSGQWINGQLPIRPVKDDPQGMGSAITYMRRYALSAIVGIAPEDDDGNAASGKSAPTPQVKPPQPEAQPLPPPPPVDPMTESTYNCIVDLMTVFPPPQKNVDKWMEKAGVSSIRDIDEDRGQAIVKWLKAKSEKVSNG